MKMSGRVLEGAAFFPPLDSLGPVQAQLFIASPAGGSKSMHLLSVGSTNFDYRSFRLNDEASLNVYDVGFAIDLRTGRPVWMAYRAPAVPHAPLTRDARTEVLIVGMGISGAMTG